MSSYGRQVLETTGSQLQLIANGAPVDWKTGGVTIDWDTVTAQATTDVTYNDERTLVVGAKGLRYGTVLARITASGKFGPHGTTAGGAIAPADGRQTLTSGDCYILNETVFEVDANSDHAAVLDGGRVWEARLNAGDTGQPTLAAVKDAFPRLSYAKD